MNAETQKEKGPRHGGCGGRFTFVAGAKLASGFSSTGFFCCTRCGARCTEGAMEAARERARARAAGQ